MQSGGAPVPGHTSAPAAASGPRAVTQGFRMPASRAVGQTAGRVGTEPGAGQERLDGNRRL